MEPVEIVVAHRERATLRIGDTYLKVDGDPARTDREVEAMELAPLPTAEILWRQPPALALAALPGRPLGHLGEPSAEPMSTWVTVGAAVRRLHDAPAPRWPGPDIDQLADRLAAECAWLVANDVIATEIVARNRALAEAVLRPWDPVFTHGDLQVDHVFVDDGRVTGVLDWSEAAPGDAVFDLATLTIGHPEHLDAVLDGYGDGVDLDLVSGWWSLRCLSNIRWLIEHGFGSPEQLPELAVLRSQAG